MSAVLNAEGIDEGIPWHYGNPLREQRLLEAGAATVDLRNRPVFTVTGPDRLTWLHAITSQHLSDLPVGENTTAFVLDPNGRIEHVFGGVDDGTTFWAHTEPGRLAPLLDWLARMVFASRVELSDRSETHAVFLGPDAPGGSVGPRIVARDGLEDALGDSRAGTWASDALRIAAGQPRVFLDTDDRTIPNELANPDGDRLGPAVHLKKGCYRGQEAIGRTYALGRPPRRLTLLHLDGSSEELPPLGSPLGHEGRVIGRVGTSSIHYELGPIALALVKRGAPTDAILDASGIAAGQQQVVDPEVGLHARPRLG